MAVKFVKSAGTITEPATIDMLGSGVIYANSIVIRDVASNAVSTAASTAMTTTNIVGVSLDYIQGASDSFIRVIPFVPGQIWEVDTANAITTAQLLLRHTMVNSLVVRNITNTYETGTTGIFFAYAITGASTGSAKMLGTFLSWTPLKGGVYASP